MTTDKYEEIKADRFGARKAMAKGKAREYSNKDDRLQNFKDAGEQFGVNPLLVAGIYWYKHVRSIESFIKVVSGGMSVTEAEKNLSEPLEGRIQDCQEYLDLIAALAHEQRSRGN